MLRVAQAWRCGVRSRFAPLVAVHVGAARSPTQRLRRSFASEATAVLVERLQTLTPRRRGALAARSAEVAEVYAEASALGAASLKEALDFRQICSLCHLLSAGSHLPDEELLQAAASQLQDLLGASKSTGSLPTEDADAAAELALAACEAGHEQGLGATVVDALCSAGVASSSTGEEGVGLSGSGAAALALAAAATGRADAPLLDALLGRCSARELDLDTAILGDLRLSACLAGPDVISALDVSAAGFLRTVCNDALLDDPRGMPEIGDEQALTPLELEVSEALHACETPHSRGAMLAGAFFPLLSHGRNCVVCAEHATVFASYVNATDQRTAWQRWKYKAATAMGLKVFAVPEAEWRALVGTEERAAFMSQVLLNPLDPATL